MTSTDANPRIYPGLNCSGLEIFNIGNLVKVFTKGKMVDFEDLPYTYHQTIQGTLNKLPEAQAILEEWHPESEQQQLKKFASCRFGGLDFTPDIKNFQLQDGEYWPCPFRGSCKGEGIVCKNPIYNNIELTTADIKILILLTTNDTNEVIGEKLNVPMGTLHKLKRILYAKLSIQTKQGAAEVVRDLNLV